MQIVDGALGGEAAFAPYEPHQSPNLKPSFGLFKFLLECIQIDSNRRSHGCSTNTEIMRMEALRNSLEQSVWFWGWLVRRSGANRELQLSNRWLFSCYIYLYVYIFFLYYIFLVIVSHRWWNISHMSHFSVYNNAVGHRCRNRDAKACSCPSQ